MEYSWTENEYADQIQEKQKQIYEDAREKIDRIYCSFHPLRLEDYIFYLLILDRYVYEETLRKIYIDENAKYKTEKTLKDEKTKKTKRR
ncbi:hypothetical protein BpHYR1_054666 [Brachionus plicatilis]|uniref:Uncharacterized protein n=1 Tax=Brachionus plicatilis TaxID=10195 RepID=A0A3M7QJV0_BRAPC|nr:hypothetical protein BpHYR1_054666 [Brachionus plicatilis]